MSDGTGGYKSIAAYLTLHSVIYPVGNGRFLFLRHNLTFNCIRS